MPNVENFNTTPNLLEAALRETPREEWATSNRVAYAYLHCPRLRGIIRTIEKKLSDKIHTASSDDLYQNVWLMVSPKLQRLDKPENVYFWLYAWFQNLLRTSSRAVWRESTIDETRCSNDPYTDHDAATHFIDRITLEADLLPDEAQIIEDRLDTEAAQHRFEEKLKKNGWPKHIPRQYRRVGRPKGS